MHTSATQSLALAVGIGAIISLACARLRIPAILFLLLAGLALGSSGIGLIDSRSFGDALGAFITVAIGVLIFEGGLHLHKGELRKAPRAVWGMLTAGALVTWVLTAVCAHFLTGLSWPVSLLLGAILMVTGPTVVQPILRRVRLTPNLHTALSAEAVLIDPIGVIATVSTLDLLLVYLSGKFGEQPWEAAWRYIRPLIGGVVIGVAMGILARLSLNLLARRRRPEATQLNLLAIAACTLAVGFGEWSAKEAGLAAATVCAVILANARVIGTREMRIFKEQISVILVGALFILLASRLDLGRLAAVGPRELAFVAAMILVVRPLSVAVGTFGSVLTSRERLFAAFFAPRGIVAASIASISAAALAELAGTVGPQQQIVPMARVVIMGESILLEQLVYQTIVLTVIIAAVGAWPLASALGVYQGTPGGVLIVGAHALGRQFAQVLHKRGIAVQLVDSNPQRIAAANEAGLNALRGDATDLRWLEDQISPEIGWVLAWTANIDVDRVICRWGLDRLGPGRGWRWRHGGSAPEDEPSILGSAPLSAVIAAVDGGEQQVRTWSADSAGPSPFAVIARNRIAFLAAGQRPPRHGEGMFVGVA